MAVASDVWERSTIIPRRFISCITVWSIRVKREAGKVGESKMEIILIQQARECLQEWITEPPMVREPGGQAVQRSLVGIGGIQHEEGT